MNDSTTDVRQRLEAERERIQGEIESLREGVNSQTFQEDEGTDTVSQHPANDGSELFEREKNLTILDTLEVTLREFDRALEKVQAGTYGTCENCGKPIAAKRLEVSPSAIYCIDCQSLLDRQGRF